MAGQNADRHDVQRNPVPRGRLSWWSMDPSYAIEAAGVPHNLTQRQTQTEHIMLQKQGRVPKSDNTALFFIYKGVTDVIGYHIFKLIEFSFYFYETYFISVFK